MYVLSLSGSNVFVAFPRWSIFWQSSGSILEGRLTSPGTTLPVQPEEPSEVADDAMEGSLALQPRIRSAKEIYSFSGMAAFFDQHKQAGTHDELSLALITA